METGWDSTILKWESLRLYLLRACYDCFFFSEYAALSEMRSGAWEAQNGSSLGTEASGKSVDLWRGCFGAKSKVIERGDFFCRVHG